MSIIDIPSVTIDHRSFSLTVPSLQLEAGEILGIFGKSGAGKTSYVKRIRELMGPGKAHYMSQFDGLLEEISIRQNIELGLAATGQSGKEAVDWETRHATLLHDFEIDRHLHKYPRSMSGGQRKRAEIVRSLIMDPAMLLLDEPFTGIGHLFEAVCTREILKRSANAHGVTMIVSHDFDLLTTFSHRIMLVDDLGVIGFIPTRESDWHPETLRTAWTLGVENVVSAEALQALRTEGLPSLAIGHSLGFWAHEAAWGKNSFATISVDRKDIQSTRLTVKQGTTYTRAEIKQSGSNELIVLTGQGMIADKSETVMLGVAKAWSLE